jgi:Holliday junction resolvasome RuvABC endonuclease subunit
MIRILAFDLSLAATGIAEPGGQLSTYKPASKGDERLADIANEIEMVSYYRPRDPRPAADLVVIEDLPMGLRNAAAGALGMLHGAVRLVLLRNRVPYLTVPPATLKTYATGRGNCTKPDMRMELFKRTDTDVADDNQCDAAWLRLLGLDLLGQSELELPAKHRRALDKLVLPAGLVEVTDLGEVGKSAVLGGGSS